MIRTLAAATLAVTLALPLTAPQARAMGHDSGTTIVFALELRQMSSKRAALTFFQPVLAYIRAQPGFIEDVLLEGGPGADSDYVHITRWQNVSDWEALYEDAAFLELVSRANPGFEPSAAQVYRPVRQ